MYKSDYFGEVGLPFGDRDHDIQILSDQLERIAGNVDGLNLVVRALPSLRWWKKKDRKKIEDVFALRDEASHLLEEAQGLSNDASTLVSEVVPELYDFLVNQYGKVTPKVIKILEASLPELIRTQRYEVKADDETIQSIIEKIEARAKEDE